MSNDGLQIVIERHSGKLHWTITDSGEEHTGQSRGVSFEDPGREIDQYLQFKKLGRHFAKQREARRISQ